MRTLYIVLKSRERIECEKIQFLDLYTLLIDGTQKLNIREVKEITASPWI